MVVLDTGNNLAYTGPMYFGQPSQGNATTAHFILDTTSGFVSVRNTYYDYSKSFSNHTADQYKNKSLMTYGNATFTGSMIMDTVCFNPQKAWSCAMSYDYFVVNGTDNTTNSTAYSQFDGVLGLAPNSTSGEGVSFIMALYN